MRMMPASVRSFVDLKLKLGMTVSGFFGGFGQALVLIEEKLAKFVAEPFVDDLGVGNNTVAADGAIVVAQSGADNFWFFFFVVVVVELIVAGVNVGKIGTLVLANLVDPFLENNVPAVVGGRENFGEFCF